MSLKERIEEDITRLYLQMDHFAETHYINDEKVRCVLDNDTALKRKNNNVSDISWDSNTEEILIFVAVSEYPGMPEPNTRVYFDRKPMLILSVSENMGMYEIMLAKNDVVRTSI